MSVDLEQLSRNDNAEVFYCNTVSAATAAAASSADHTSPRPDGMGEEEDNPEEESFYVNVQH